MRGSDALTIGSAAAHIETARGRRSAPAPWPIGSRRSARVAYLSGNLSGARPEGISERNGDGPRRPPPPRESDGPHAQRFKVAGHGIERTVDPELTRNQQVADLSDVVQLVSVVAIRWLPRAHQSERRGSMQPSNYGGSVRGQGRDRTADLPLFRRSLIPTELPGRLSRVILANPRSLANGDLSVSPAVTVPGR